MRSTVSAAVLAGVVFLATGCASRGPTAAVTQAAAGARQLMLVANDEKMTWDDAGKVVAGPLGRDTVSVVDIGTDPLNPRILANLPLPNTIAGPPTNLAITPDGTLALVANSMLATGEGTARKNGTRQPAVRAGPDAAAARADRHRDGRQAAVGPVDQPGRHARADRQSRRQLRICAAHPRQAGRADRHRADGRPSHACAVRADGSRAFAAKFAAHKIALLDVEGEKVSYDKVDLPTGLWPYNFDVTPDGRLLLTADNGNAGAADGHVDTVSVFDLQATPVRLIDKVVVGDAPEGFVVSPTGRMAVAVLLRGSNAAKTAPFYHRNGSVVALRIDGDKVTRTQRSRGSRLARRRGVQRRRPISLCGQLQR